MQRSLLVQTLLNMATGSGGAKLEELVVDAAGTFDAGSGKGYNPVTVPSGSVNALGEKGVVSNNSVVVTPKAQVVGGWVNDGEVSGAGVGVTASELVSGTLNVSSDGVQDVTNYQNISVPSAGHSASAHKGVVTDHSIIVTPRSTATQGFVQAGTVEGAGVSVSAEELVSGSLAVTANGTFDVTNYKYVEVNMSNRELIYNGTFTARGLMGTLSNCLSWSTKYYGLMFHYKLNSYGSGLGSVNVGLSTTTTDIDQWGTGLNGWGVAHLSLAVGAEVWHPCTFSRLNGAFVQIMDPSGTSQYNLRINDTMYVVCMCAQGYAVNGTIEIYGLLI